MKKIFFLLPPSEGKNSGGDAMQESLSFHFEKPHKIAMSATQKDLKCQGSRYEEAIELNTNLADSLKRSAIQRYSGVMYNAIGYEYMSDHAQKFFENHFYILSGMYGILKPNDLIGNYKLPIETKGLYGFWSEKITQALGEFQVDYIVDLLPNAYKKMIDFSALNIPTIHINFLQEKNGKIQKISHGVKKIKGQWIRNICENQTLCYTDFGGEVIKGHPNIDVNILISNI